MSVNAKARTQLSIFDYMVDTRRKSTLLYAMVREMRVKSAGVSSRPVGTASATSPFSDNALQRSGGVMSGPIAFNPIPFLITSDEPDTLRIDETFGKYTSRIIVTGFGGVADDISKIIGKDDGLGNTGKAAFAGQFLIIDASLGGDITLKEGTDFSLPGAVDFVIPAGQNIALIYDSTSDKWQILDGALGTAGISFPLLYPNFNHGSIGGPTLTIDLSLNTAHVHVMTVTGDIAITFINPPTSSKTVQFELVIIQDATGGRTITFTNTLNQTPTIDTDADGRTIVVFQTVDGGVTYDALTATSTTGGGGAGGGMNTNLDNMTSPTIPPVDLDMNDLSILGLKNLDFDDAASNIQGLVTLNWSQANQKIESLAGETRFTVADLQKFTFFSLTDPILEIKEATAGAFELDLLDHNIDDVGQFILSDAVNLGLISNQPMMTYSNTGAIWRYNVPTIGDAYEFRAAGTVKMFGINFRVADPALTEFEWLIFDTSGLDPAVNGEMTRNGVDVKVFSGGAIRNFSDISAGGGANTFLSNLSLPTAINRDLIPDLVTGFNIGTTGAGNQWASAFVDRVRFLNAVASISTEVTILKATTPDRVEFGVPIGFEQNWDIDGIRELLLNASTFRLDGVELDMDFHDIIKPIDIGDATNPATQVFVNALIFPLNTGLTAANFEIIRQSSAADRLLFNVPTDKDFYFVEQGDTTDPLLAIKTISNAFIVGGGITQIAINPITGNQGQIFKVASNPFNFISIDGFKFDFAAAGIDWDNNIFFDVRKLEIATTTGVAVAELKGLLGSPNIYQLNLLSGVDFDIGTTGGSILNYDHSALKFTFGNINFVEMAGDYRASGSLVIGYKVTDSTVAIGDDGTMQAPTYSEDGSVAGNPTDAELDTHFGAINGAFGTWRDTNTDSNSRLFYRLNNGQWYHILLINSNP